MNMMIFDTPEQLAEAAASVITDTVQAKPGAVLGLATGGTQVDVYRYVVQTFRKGIVSFRSAMTFNLDEYVGLAADHAASYHTYMKEHLFESVDFTPAQTHLPNGNAVDLQEECRRYDNLILQAGGIDLQLLGLGHNGHIGFNEPARELSTETHVVELADVTIAANARYFESAGEVPKKALTMGVGTILQARTILLVVKGAEKAAIVERALKGPITTDCPASLLQLHPHLIVLLDRDAAREIA